jgi:hypothetical protein
MPNSVCLTLNPPLAVSDRSTSRPTTTSAARSPACRRPTSQVACSRVLNQTGRSSTPAPITSAKCRPGTSTPASACGRTAIAAAPTGARCSRRRAGWCSAAAPSIGHSRVRRGQRQYPVGVHHQLRHHRSADHVHRGWEAVPRRARRLGRRCARHDERREALLPWRSTERAAGGCHLRVRAERMTRHST